MGSGPTLTVSPNRYHLLHISPTSKHSHRWAVSEFGEGAQFRPCLLTSYGRPPPVSVYV